jgi:3-hydroxyisobutyrate dehydrogenase
VRSVAVIAFLGLGRMGAPMAANLAAAGYQLIVYNRTRATALEVADDIGAAAAETPRDAADGADFVIPLLADERALFGVYEGDDGVLAGLRDGTVAVDMGTTGPDGVARLAQRVAAAGGVLLDAPVSGSTAAAEAARLVVMAGGPRSAFRSAEPLLSAVAATVFHLGDTGAGAITKLAVNNIIYALGNAISESLVLAERAGLERRRVYDVFENSAVAAPMVRYRRAAFLEPDTTRPAFAMSLARKDLELITGLAASLGVPTAQAEANLSLIGAAVEAGLGDRDMADVAVYLRGASELG